MRAIISTIALVRQKSNLISQFTGLWLLMKAITTQELKLATFFNYNHNHIISCESKIVHTTTLDTCTLYTHVQVHCTYFTLVCSNYLILPLWRIFSSLLVCSLFDDSQFCLNEYYSTKLSNKVFSTWVFWAVPLESFMFFILQVIFWDV